MLDSWAVGQLIEQLGSWAVGQHVQRAPFDTMRTAAQMQSVKRSLNDATLSHSRYHHAMRVVIRLTFADSLYRRLTP
jgi:hypothetical protein